MEKNEITPSLRLDAHHTTADFDKADITHIETGRVGLSALEDETLMSGESQERVGRRYFSLNAQLADVVAYFVRCLLILCRGCIWFLLWLRHWSHLSLARVDQGRLWTHLVQR
jgi:hypothetical protein